MPSNSTKLKDQAKKRLSSNSGTIAFMMVACTLALVLSFVFSKQLVGDIGFNNKVIKAKNKVNDTLKQNLEAVDELKTNFDELASQGPQVSRIMTALPTKPDYPALAGQLEGMAARAGVQLINITVNDGGQEAAQASGAPSLQEVKIQASATGEYAKLQDMLKNLESSLRPMVINAIDFSGSDPTVTLEIEFTSYYQPETIISDETETLQ